MRNIVFLILLTAIAIGGGVLLWPKGGDTPVMREAVSVPSASPAQHSTSTATGPQKVIPKPAPFTRPRPQTVPAVALPQNRLPAQPQTSAPRRYEAAEGPIRYRSINDLILAALDENLGRPASYKLLINRSGRGWSYLCGQPLETDKTTFDYARSRLKRRAESGQIEDLFCLLAVQTNSGFELKELALGTADNPMSDWADKYAPARALILGP